MPSATMRKPVRLHKTAHQPDALRHKDIVLVGVVVRRTPASVSPAASGISANPVRVRRNGSGATAGMIAVVIAATSDGSAANGTVRWKSSASSSASSGMSRGSRSRFASSGGTVPAPARATSAGE